MATVTRLPAKSPAGGQLGDIRHRFQKLGLPASAVEKAAEEYNEIARQCLAAIDPPIEISSKLALSEQQFNAVQDAVRDLTRAQSERMAVALCAIVGLLAVKHLDGCALR